MEKLLTSKEAADLLGITMGALRVMRLAGRISPAQEWGDGVRTTYLYSRAAVKDYIKHRKSVGRPKQKS